MSHHPALAAFAIVAGLLAASPSFAAGVFLEVPMTRVFACEGAEATMEIYLPQSLLAKRDIETQGLGRTVNGLYTLDLTGAQKGKVIEPVRLRSTKDNKAIVMEQITRKDLKPATIPMAGGTLDVDERLGKKARCGAFRLS